MDLELDLHWSGGTLLSKKHGKKLYKRSIDADTILHSGNVPPIADELALVILHGSLTNSNDNYNWLVDVYIMNKSLSKEDWHEAENIAIEEGKEDYFQYGLEILKKEARVIIDNKANMNLFVTNQHYVIIPFGFNVPY